MRADVASPTYLGGLRYRTGGGTPRSRRAHLGPRRRGQRRGVRIHEGTRGRSMRGGRAAVEVATDAGSIRARQVVVATNAYPPLLRRLRNCVMPIYDHVLVTEPLSPAQLGSIGWAERQGLTDVGNQFHYYRRTAGRPDPVGRLRRRSTTSATAPTRPASSGTPRTRCSPGSSSRRSPSSRDCASPTAGPA